MRSLLFATTVLGLASCSWSKFSDLEDKAPALRIEQAGEIKSGTVGDGLLGLDRGADQVGGALFFGANGDATLGTALITAAGAPTVSGADRAKMKDKLGNPTRILDVARAPVKQSIGGTSGPHALVGAPGAILVVDINLFFAADSVKPAADWPAVIDFGLSVTLARLGTAAREGSGEELAVGARDSVVLIRTERDAWPLPLKNERPLVISSGSDWPTGDFRVIAAGNLRARKGSDPETDEVVAAAPEKNAVVVLYDLWQCLEKPLEQCKNYFRLEPPAGAQTFGSALLIADLDGDGKLEIAIGAPGANRVHIFRIEDADFTPGSKSLQPVRTLEMPSARGFGSALALGRFLGGSDLLLAVGAPSAEVGGKLDSGRLFLFKKDYEPLVAEGVALATPEASTLIGRRLATMPFRTAPGGATLDVLAAAGRDAVYLFFAGLTPNHADVRVR
jgi:hypothetical protein